VAPDDRETALHALPVQHIGMSRAMQSARITPTAHGPLTWVQNAVTMVVHCSPTVCVPALLASSEASAPVSVGVCSGGVEASLDPPELASASVHTPLTQMRVPLQSVSSAHPTLSAGGGGLAPPHAIGRAAKRAAVIACAILRPIGTTLPVRPADVASVARALFFPNTTTTSGQNLPGRAVSRARRPVCDVRGRRKCRDGDGWGRRRFRKRDFRPLEDPLVTASTPPDGADLDAVAPRVMGGAPWHTRCLRNCGNTAPSGRPVLCSLSARPMASTLRPCPYCSRHVRVSEPACPFCAGKLDDAFRSIPSPRVRAVGRLSRAALFALGASGLAATACGSGSGTGSDGSRSGTGNVFAPYGAPPLCVEDGSCEIVGISSGSVGAAYGGSPPIATLCGDPVCPPLPGEDASFDGSMADGAGGSDAGPSDAAVSDADAASDAADAGQNGG
jgi:hypothetical protein